MLIVMAAMMSAACVEEVVDPAVEESSEKVEMVFSASCADDTKATLVNGTEVWWEPGDYIAVNGDSFQATIFEPSPTTEFIGSTVPSERYYALYPYMNHWLWDGKVTEVYIPINQYAIEGSLGYDQILSVATATNEDMNFHFKNQLGYIKFSIDETSDPITSVAVLANGDERVAGWGTIDFSGEEPLFSIFQSPTKNPVTLHLSNGSVPGDYYIALFPDTYSAGLSFIFSTAEGISVMKSIDSEITLPKGVIKDIGLISGLNFENQPSQRDALIAFYNATNGDEWIDNTNWCSDRPISEWYGVRCESNGGNEEVVGIYMPDNNLSGYLPPEIGDLYSIVDLYLDGFGINQIGGSIPKEIGKLKRLRQLYLGNNRLTGSIPVELCELNLDVCYLSGNQLSGQYPPELAKLLDGIDDFYFELRGNEFTGTIPEEIARHPRFEEFWPEFLLGMNCTSPDQLDLSGLEIPAPKGMVTTIDGTDINLEQLYASNKYTILYNWASWCPYSPVFTTELLSLYEAYKPSGVEVIGYVGASSWQFPSDDLSSIRNAVDQYGISWDNVAMIDNEKGGTDNFLCALFKMSTPDVLVVDPEGRVVLQNLLDLTGRYDGMQALKEFLCENLGEVNIENPDIYESMDYSRDGFVEILQTATSGKGIDIVLMGDAYSDRMIADGRYISDMTIVAESLFAEEPFRSFKDCFNVYVVNVVSKNEIYIEGTSTAIGVTHVEGTTLKGNDSICMEYALKAIGHERMDEALMVVVMNQSLHAGTCYMYESVSDSDYGGGTSVAYFAKSISDADFRGLVQHESLGHGFAKLADEYSYAENGHIPDEEIQYYKAMEQYGWWKNADFTDDPAQVKWHHFLSDSRYANDGLGVYEGALTFWTGAYRPTENSIMRYNWGGFNAPSREAIYYRIHKLAYGPDWEYDYEKFVEYDAINRKSASEGAAIQKRRMNYVEKPFEPTAPPVIINGSWRDAVTH